MTVTLDVHPTFPPNQDEAQRLMPECEERVRAAWVQLQSQRRNAAEARDVFERERERDRLALVQLVAMGAIAQLRPDVPPDELPPLTLRRQRFTSTDLGRQARADETRDRLVASTNGAE